MAATKERTSAKWSDETDSVFLDLCTSESVKGNRPGSSLNREGWKNVMKVFNQKTHQQLDQKQLKNRWDQLKREWTLYKNVMNLTGIGWDPIKHTIEASEEWWEAQIKVNVLYKKLKGKDMSIIAEKAGALFRDTVATGERARASTQRSGIGLGDDSVGVFPNTDCDENDNAEGSGDSDELLGGQNASRRQSELFPPSRYENATSSGSKRKRSGTSSIKEGIQSLLNIAVTKSHETSSYIPPTGPTVEECMQLLDRLEDVEKYTSFYYFSTTLFEKTNNRKIFMAYPDDRARVGWLHYLHAKEMKKSG